MKQLIMRNAEIVAAYERLRGDTFDAIGVRPAAPGRALFLRQGMAAWMRAWTACPKPSAMETESAPCSSPTLSHTLLAQVTMILAGMLVGQCRECTP